MAAKARSRWKPFLPSSDRGFTLLELLVAMMLGLIMTGLSLAAILSNRYLYRYDIAKTKLNQDLRSSMDLVGVNIREAGENLAQTFPAVEIIDGASGAPDELVLRRNLLDEVLKLCQPLASGSGTAEVYFAYTGTEPGCAYNDQQHNFDIWQQYRLANTGTVRAYIYDSNTQSGEFFDYSNEQSTGSTRYIVRDWGTWVNDYSVGQTGVYIIEEWRFRIGQDWNFNPVFQVIPDAEDWNPLNVAYGVTDFQVLAHLEDSSTQTSFATTDDWTRLSSIEVNLTGQNESTGETIAKTYSARFFPRNILSN